jgi:hypothetical protein
MGGIGGAGGGVGTATCSDGLQNGDETGIDCGGSTCAACPFALLLATGSVSATAAHLNGPLGAWTTVSLPGYSVDEPALAISGGQGIGLMRFTQLGNAADNELQYTTWTNNVWSNFAPIAAGVTTDGPPTIGASAAGAQASFHGFNFENYFASFTGGIWAPTAEMVGSSGARAGDIAVTGTGSTLVFARGLSNELVARDRAGVGWLSEQVIATGSQFDYTISPEVVSLDSGPELMVAFVAPGGQVSFATRTFGVWSTVASVSGATTSERVALTALPGGNAALAFRGMDGNLYATLFMGSAWSAPVQVASLVMNAPAIAQGVGAAYAELAYIGNDGNVYHSRFITNAWTPPAYVAGPNLVGVAIASSP